MEPNGQPAPADGAQPQAPAAPVAPQAPVDNQPTGEEAEAQDWGDAVDEIFPGLRSPKKPQEGNKNEPTDPNATTQTTQAPTDGQNGQDPSKPAGEGEENGDEQVEEENEPDFSSRDSRATQRELAAERDAMVSDVKQKVFANVPRTLVDADGDPIRGIEDVMKLINPRTITADNPQGRTFTEEEAGMWFLSASQRFNQEMAQLDKQAEQIAEVNLDLRDDADMIRYKYGELLKVLPDPDNPKKLFRDTLMQEYEKTLVRDPNTNTITRTPMPLRTFYERALAPYARQAAEAEAAAGNNGQPAPQPGQPAQPAQPAQPTRTQTRTDRSDIFGGTDPKNGQDPEDAEWAAAATTVFGPRKN